MVISFGGMVISFCGMAISPRLDGTVISQRLDGYHFWWDFNQSEVRWQSVRG